MPLRHALLRTLWIFLWAWVACVASYLLGIVLTTIVAESMPSSAAAVVAFVLVAGEVLVTFLSIAWTNTRLAEVLQPAARWFWVVAFAVLQLGTCGIAAITTLLALNR